MNSYGDLVTLLRAPLVDGYGGQQVRDWTQATETPDVPASVQAQRVTEQDTSREVIVTSKHMNTDGSVDIVETDRVRWRSKTYDVTGVEPEYQQGVLDHLEVTLELVEEPAQ